MSVEHFAKDIFPSKCLRILKSIGVTRFIYCFRATKNLNLNTSPSSVEQQITPWDVRGQVIDGVEVGIDYSKLMDQFGCQPISEDLIRRFEKQTGRAAHPLLRRGAFYCHRYPFSKVTLP